MKPLAPIAYDYSGLIAPKDAPPCVKQTGLVEADLRWLAPRLTAARQEVLENLVAFRRGLPVAELEKNLRAILDRARKEGTRVILAGAMLPENYGEDYRKAFRSLFPRLAKEYRLPFLPFLLEGVAMIPGFNQEDGIHPNAEGARRVADNVWRVLAPELKR